MFRRFADAHIKLFNSVKSLRGISGHKNVLKHKENYLKKEITKMREDFRQRKISRKVMLHSSHVYFFSLSPLIRQRLTALSLPLRNSNILEVNVVYSLLFRLRCAFSFFKLIFTTFFLMLLRDVYSSNFATAIFRRF